MTFLATEVIGKLEPYNLSLPFCGLMAHNTSLYRIPFLPYILATFIVMMTFFALNPIILRMSKVRKEHLLVHLSFVSLIIDHYLFRGILRYCIT
jgi:hypothetical protein